MSDNINDQAIREIAKSAGATLEAAMFKALGKMTPEEVAKFGTAWRENAEGQSEKYHSGYKLAKTLLLAVAADVLTAEYDAETITRNIPKVRRIARSHR